MLTLKEKIKDMAIRLTCQIVGERSGDQLASIYVFSLSIPFFIFFYFDIFKRC